MPKIETRVERKFAAELRPTTGSEIERYLRTNWDKKLDIEILTPGEKAVVPKGWHGAGFQYDAKVDFGDLLTTPIAGTELSPTSFVSWLSQKGFLFERGNSHLDARAAAALLGSSEQPVDGVPVFRAWRRDGKNVPIEIEFYNGSRSNLMQKLTYLGNKGPLTEDEKAAYSGVVANLISPFISKGTTKVAEHLRIAPGYRRIARKDDCLATGGTFAADKIVSMKIDALEKVQEKPVWVDDVAIATTQAVVVAIYMAERYKTPLLMRVGAASFGLDGSNEGLNYMRNTQPEMARLGKFTSGDFGDNMYKTYQSTWNPAVIQYGHGSPLRMTKFYLRGGGPIMDLMFR